MASSAISSHFEASHIQPAAGLCAAFSSLPSRSESPISSTRPPGGLFLLHAAIGQRLKGVLKMPAELLSYLLPVREKPHTPEHRVRIAVPLRKTHARHPV